MIFLLLLLKTVVSINWDYDDRPKTTDNPGNKSNNREESKDGSTNPMSDNSGRNSTSNNMSNSSSNKVKLDTSELKEYMEYCQAKYRFFKKRENYKLERLVVIFRHGDRAPIRNISKDWKNRNCVECPLSGNTINSCKTKKCKNGDLTVKGSKQAKDLGKFIKDNYKPLLFEKDIVESEIGYRTTSVKRTHSTLFNLMSGITSVKSLRDVDIKKGNDGLLRQKNCMFLETALDKDSEVNESLQDKLESLSLDDPKKVSEKSDEIRCSMCNDVAVDCGSNSCDVDILRDILKLSFSTWNRQMKNISYCEKGKRIIFGRFAKDLLEILDSDKLLYLVSAHDGSLGMILSAISSENFAWPPYASALFIEVWCKYGRQFVRLIFNDKIVEFEEYSGEYIPINKFTDFLERIKLEDGEIESLCGQNVNNSPGSNLKASILSQSYTQLVNNKLTMNIPLFN